MAKLSNISTRIYLDQFNLSGDLNSSSLDYSQETPEVTCFSDDGPRRLVGNYGYKSSDLGFFNADAGGSSAKGLDAATFALISDTDADHYLTKLFGANAQGSPCYTQTVRLSSRPLSGAIGGAVLLNMESDGAGGAVRGTVLANLTLTSANNTNGINIGVKASGIRYQVVFRLMSFTGTSVTIVVQESSDNGSGDAYAAVAGLTSGALTSGDKVMASTTAAMEAWLRVVATGTFSNAVVLVTAGNVVGTS